MTELADLMCSHCTHLGPNDKVLFHAFDIPEGAVAEFAQDHPKQWCLRLE